ncbi:nucleotidyltransferase family protein [Arthrobacter sp. AOP36-C1-22]|uniref:nucleotidyltransferase family protein n=1 Tax=Arthrobacter sp. AOP36-C1-22 TaxID=3457683 RepID=UPI0040343609
MNNDGGVYPAQQQDTTLLSQESVLLSGALVARICEDLQIRILFVKGPVAAQMGVRAPGDSGDIDLLVEPGSTQTVVEGLAIRGWQLRSSEDNVAHPIHSVTMFHPRWPTDIDIHFSFPGIEAPAASYFPMLWEHRQVFGIAGRPVFGLDLAGATIIQALHALRASSLPKNTAEINHLLQVAPKPAWNQIHRLAADIDALAAMKPYLLATYPEAAWVGFPDVSAEWLQRTEVSAPGVHRLLQLSSAPRKQWPALVFRALFPPRNLLESNNLTLHGASSTEVIKVRILRWASFLRALRRVAREFLTVKRGQKRDGT